MTVHATAAPKPRSAEEIEVVATALPWPESGQPRTGTRPRSQYWDVATAAWQCSPASTVVPVPRQGD